MEIQVICRSEERKAVLESCAKFYAKALNLKNSRFTLTIHSKYQLTKTKGSNGEVSQYGPKSIHMELDSRLPFPRLLLTLAHEMVHVKQIAKGQYRGRLARNGRVLSCWRGVAIRAEYEKRPWEIEAFGRQMDLLEDLLAYVARKKKG